MTDLDSCAFNTKSDMVMHVDWDGPQPGPSGLVARRSLTALEDPSSIPDAV